MPDAAVELRGVSKEFAARDRRVVALRDIDFSIAHDEFAAILGPSGCGKSTLLNMVAGFDRPSGGRSASMARPWRPRIPVGAWSFRKPRSFPGTRCGTT
jgi:NitT/TauT family transport system ATP-binding protein